jgi:two-component system, LytTR family, sensor kinase
MVTSLDLRRRLMHTAGVVAGCSVLALSEALNVYAMRRGIYVSRQSPRPSAVAMTWPSWLLMALTAPAIVWLVRRYAFAGRNWVRSAVVHALVGVVFAVTHLAVMSVIYLVLDSQAIVWANFARVFMVCFRFLFYLEVLTYWTIVGIYLVLYYSSLRTSLAEARLAALQAQLNPHFLFNTLNAVAALALKGDQAAVAEMLGRLSDLLRATLDGGSQEVPLSVEIGLVDDYMAIQRIRFADRLQVKKTVAPEAMDGLVPRMILQPIVENAIEHGISRRRDAGEVNITATRQNGRLVIEVCDSGAGFPVTDQREGVGLANTRARLEELYGQDHRFEFGRSPQGGAAVRMTIPFRSSAPA